MSNVLFDRSSLKVVGINRAPLSFEVEINNVDPTDLQKVIQVPTTVDKVDAAGNQLYLLPQDPLESDVPVTSVIETTTPTDRPVMVSQVQKTPLLDADGNPVTYPQTVRGETPDETAEPVMIDVVAEDGSVTQEQKVDDQGHLLFWGQVPTGVEIPCFTTEEIQVQATDGNGEKLYFEDVTNVEKAYTPQPDLEVTDQDPKFIPGLDKATELQETAKTILFTEDQSAFVYADIVAAKQKQIVGQTFYAGAQLYEEMDASIFDPAETVADFGFDVVSIPQGGTVQTLKITLPRAVGDVRIVSESSQALSISVGDTTSDLQALDSNSERLFDVPVSTLFIRFENKNATRTDLTSFAILY